MYQQHYFEKSYVNIEHIRKPKMKKYQTVSKHNETIKLKEMC